MFWSTFIDLQHPFIFKYQFDKDKYVMFFIPIHQTNLFNIRLPVKRSIQVLGQGKAIIQPKVKVVRIK